MEEKEKMPIKLRVKILEETMTRVIMNCARMADHCHTLVGIVKIMDGQIKKLMEGDKV